MYLKSAGTRPSSFNRCAFSDCWSLDCVDEEGGGCDDGGGDDECLCGVCGVCVVCGGWCERADDDMRHNSTIKSCACDAM